MSAIATACDHAELPPSLSSPSGDVSVVVHPAHGGRIGQIAVDGQPLLVDPPDPAAATTKWGSFPMAPWVGRIRRGEFQFDGTHHKLATNHVDGAGGAQRTHSIHGTVFSRAWQVIERGDSWLAMSCPLTGALDWPFEGIAHQRIDVDTDHVQMSLRIETEGDPFPAEIGWHPWFRKPQALSFAPTAMYRRDEFGLPTGALVNPRPGPWDDCFVNTAPVALRYGRRIASLLTVTSDCDHLVVYDHPADATCVEPQSGPPDALNLDPLVFGHHLVSSEQPLERTMTISW